MLNLISQVTKSLMPIKTQTSNVVTKKSNNPFAFEGSNENFFLSSNRNNSATYAKNQPLEGGYFAGYYNGKPNIVGRRLFIEV